MPSETNLTAGLKNSILSIENLWVHLEYTENMSLDKMCEIITRWRGAGSNLVVSEPVANFVGKPDWKKKAYVKQAKNMSGRKFEKKKMSSVRQSWPFG